MKKKSIDHTQLLLLKLLSTEDMYGYQIILELARRSSNVFEMKEGTLYPVLHGMEGGISCRFAAIHLLSPQKLRPQAACANTITSRVPAGPRSQKRRKPGRSTAAR